MDFSANADRGRIMHAMCIFKYLGYFSEEHFQDCYNFVTDNGKLLHIHHCRVIRPIP